MNTIRSQSTPGTCRFCGSDETDEHGLDPIKYGVRHSAHPDCLLAAKGANTWTLFHDWQLDQFPALAAGRAGLYDSLCEAIRSRRERTGDARVEVRRRRILGANGRASKYVHAVPPPGYFYGTALCGARPANRSAWSNEDEPGLTCPICIQCIGVQRVGEITVFTCSSIKP